MKKHLLFSLLFAGSLIFSLTATDAAHAQIPGAIISAGGLAGVQSSNVNGIGWGNYYAVRGSFASFFGEVRHTNWSGSAASLSDNGILGGMDFSLFGITLAGGVGVGSATYQTAAVAGMQAAPQTYTSFLYEAQAMYPIHIVGDFITLGIGADYIGEANSVQPIAGWGGVASLNIGL